LAKSGKELPFTLGKKGTNKTSQHKN